MPSFLLPSHTTFSRGQRSSSSVLVACSVIHHQFIDWQPDSKASHVTSCYKLSNNTPCWRSCPWVHLNLISVGLHPSFLSLFSPAPFKDDWCLSRPVHPFVLLHCKKIATACRLLRPYVYMSTTKEQMGKKYSLILIEEVNAAKDWKWNSIIFSSGTLVQNWKWYLSASHSANQIQSQSYFVNDGLSVSSSWCWATPGPLTSFWFS